LGIDSLHEDRRTLDFGTFCHLILERIWNGEPWREFADNNTPDQVNRFEAMRAKILCLSYEEFWDPEEFETIATEVEFNIPLINPQTGSTSRSFRLSGKIDAIAKDRFGDVWVIEHKTTSLDISAGSVYWEKLFLDEQVSMYILAVKLLGYNPVGCVYDVLQKPGVKPFKATPVEKRKYTEKKKGQKILFKNQHARDETVEKFTERLIEMISKDPNKYFARGEITRTEKDLHDFQMQLWDTSQEMLHNERKKIFTKNSEGCFKYNRACKFFDLCCQTSNIDDERWVKKQRIHLELGDTKNEARPQ